MIVLFLICCVDETMDGVVGELELGKCRMMVYFLVDWREGVLMWL